MASIRPINQKANKIAQEVHAAKEAQGASEDIVALQSGPGSKGKVYHPMGCTLNFTPGWEIDISGGTAGLCQPVERDLFDCYIGCGWPAQVPDHLNNAHDWTDKCASATNDWRKIDIVFP